MNNISLFSIKSKFIHLSITSFLPKLLHLKIAKHSKKLQSLTDLSIEDYEVYHLQFQKNQKIFTFEKTSISSSLKTLQTIIDLTQSYPLYNNHKEISTPTPIYAMVQMKNNHIIASTESSLLFIDYDTFNIVSEVKISMNGVVNYLKDLGNNTLLMATFYGSIKFMNLSTFEITNEITGSNPLLLSGDKLAYTWEGKDLRVISLNSNFELEEIHLDEIHKCENESLIVISSMIELNNGNILVSSWNGALSEYNLKTRICIFRAKVEVEFVDFLLELKDERIAFTVNDNAHIYIYDKNGDKNMFTLVGHNKNVIELVQLQKEQILSASNDGKIKFWMKKKNTFFCTMTLFLFNDYIRKFIILTDGRICVAADDKCIRAFGVKNFIGNFVIRYEPYDKDGKGNFFEIVDNRYN